jgi:outer membrane protein OmpA-like peptidoglycan-associated protein
MKQILGHIVLIQLAISGYSLVFAQTDPDTVSSSEIEQALKKSKTRAIGVRAKPKVDLNIPFEINSSSLRPDAKAQLEYNRRLSRDRAETVRRFLVTRGIDPDRLEVVGNGEDELLLPDWPLHEDNRRVEIRNLGEGPSN